jgi:hypothetical protein
MDSFYGNAAAISSRLGSGVVMKPGAPRSNEAAGFAERELDAEQAQHQLGAVGMAGLGETVENWR